MKKPSTSTYRPVGRPLDDHDLWWLTELAAALGPPAAAKQIGISRGTLASALAGLAVSATTEERVQYARRLAA